MTTTESRTSERRPRPLNEETIEAVRRRIGIPTRYSPPSHNEMSSSDSFRHFANGYGDDNPLYCDREYASASSWGSSIAPPLYAFSAGIARQVHWSDAEKTEMSGGDPLAGIGQYMCGERWLLPRPIRAGDVLWKSQSLYGAELKSSRFGGGTGALVSHRVAWEDEGGSPFAFRFLDFWHADREGSAKSAKYRDLERPHYSDEDLERIDACYEAETVRGAMPRLVRDVKVGEELGPIVKSPMSLTDILSWHTGTGWGMFGGGAWKLAYKNRRRIPKFYQKNEVGYWDSAQRCHWEDAWAKELGHPAPYDYGVVRSCWLAHLVTNWMGDDAWLWKLSTSVRRFNYIGDMHYVSGVVHDVDVAANTVTIDAKCVNQRGETTCDGRAVVVLPPPGGGAAVVPEYQPDDVPEAAGP